MGKQTNAFQRLCVYLQEQFYLPATVEESAFLADKYTGEPREIDVLVTVPVDGYTMTIGFVDDVTFVELTLCKRESTGVNLSVLYSSSGFSEPARKKAEIFGMRLVTAEEGLKEDWPMWLRDLKTAYMGTISLSPSGVTIETTEGLVVAPPPELPVVDDNGQPLAAGIDLKSVVHNFIQAQMPSLLQDVKPGTKGMGEFRIDFGKSINVADLSGKLHRVVRLSGKLTWDAPTRIAIDLRHKRVEGVSVIFGEGKLDDRRAEFHWLAGPNGEKAIGTLQAAKDKPQRVEMQRMDDAGGGS